MSLNHATGPICRRTTPSASDLLTISPRAIVATAFRVDVEVIGVGGIGIGAKNGVEAFAGCLLRKPQELALKRIARAPIF